ncbi:MAG: DUF4038 domain-containing protein [Planctomycetota bacterium]
MREVAEWHVYEVELESERDYENPIWDVEPIVTFSAPSGAEHTVEAFWDGGRTWRARFSPGERGRWSWRSDCRGARDDGLCGRVSEFDCVRYEGRDLTYLRGPVEMSVDRRRFVHADGAPFFWLADTAWNGAIRSREEDWDLYLRKRNEQGFSVIQFVTTQWRGCSRDPHGEVAYRTEGEKLAVNPKWFRRLDRRVRAVNDHGLVAAPVVLWACTESDPGRALAPEKAARLARYIVSRYQAHHVVWILGGDGDYREPHAERWAAIGREAFRAQLDRPVAMHLGGQSWIADELREEGWLDVIGYQSGHGSSEEHLRWLVEGPPTRQWNEGPEQAVLNMEPNYEGHPSYHEDLVFNDRHVRRAAYWSLLLTPTAGVSYGNNNIWAWQARPERAEGHEGLGWIGPWRDGLEPPGVHCMVLLERFFDSISWWELRPAPHLAARQPGRQDPARFVAAAMSETGDLAVLYTPRGGTLKLDVMALQRPARARWYNPRKGGYVEAGTVEGEQAELRTPDRRDWVLKIER